jgi:anti-anti-sigma regulatory factor
MLTSSGLDVVVGRALGTVLMTVHGPLDRGAAPDLAASIDVVLNEHPERVVIDLSGVTDLDDAGTKVLRHAKSAAEASQVRFELTSRPNEVLSALGDLEPVEHP